MLPRGRFLSTRASWPERVGSISVEPKSPGTLRPVRGAGPLAWPFIGRWTSVFSLDAVPLHRRVRLGALLAGAGLVLGQPHFIEDQGRPLDEPERHQAKGQVLRKPAAEYEGAGDARDDEQPGGAEAYDP
jgi:hypothetical protein